MAKLIEVSDIRDLKELKTLVEHYNAIGDDNNSDIKKLFTLQRINYFIQKNLDNDAVVTWRNQLGESGLERHLQHYGIHRDSSQLLQSVEFANAVRHFTLNAPPLERTTQSSFYSAMKKRNDLFTQDPTPEALKNYVKYNTVITSHYEFNEGFQEKVQRHKHFLALSYAKIDAIQGVVKQNFDEYQTRVLGSSTGNNKNFIFNVDGETEKLVIRVEDRHDLGDELALQTESVSEYFSEDYATLMLPFSEEGEINYQPVVISEFAKKGDLRSYAESFSGQKPERIANEAEYIFGKLSDFSIKLMDSGHYHPDIKLTNFLTDGERVILSDRKTLTNIKNPRVTEISSSPMYGAPEYQQCVGNGTLNYKAFHTTLDMPSYMSYQVGMALKEFMFVSGVVPLSSTDEDETTQQFLDWNSITQNMKSPPNDVRNISVLIQELTRTKPTERLPLQHFQSLLTKISLPQEQFLDELNKRSPSEKLSNHQDIELIKEFLNADELTPELEKKLEALQDIDNTLQDPRLNLSALLQGKPLQRINQYIKEVNNAKIDELLLKKDLERAGWGSRFLHRLTGGRYSVPRAATLTDIKDDLPKMDNLTATCVDLYLEHGGVLSGMKPSQRNLLQQLSQLSSRDEPDMVADKDVAKYTENRTVFEKETVVPAQQISKKASPLSETNEYNTMVTHEEADTSTVVVKPILSADKADDYSTVVTHDEADTGTVVVKPILSADKADDYSTVVTHDEADTGTVVVKPTLSADKTDDYSTVVTHDEADTGTVVVKPTLSADKADDYSTVVTHDEVDTGTVVIAKSNNNQSVVDKSAAPHKDFMKQSSSITDILSTISRGNAAKEAVLKSQLMDMKKSAQSESSELDSDTQSIAKP